MGEYSQQKVVAASGAAQTLTAASNGVDPVFDITLTANCALTLSGQATSPIVRMQTITVILRQDATGGRLVTLPVGVRWPAGFVPQLSTAIGAIDILQFTTFDGSNWFGFPVGFSMSAASIALASVGTATTGSPVAVTGTYGGTPPQAIEYQIGSGAWTSVSATISGGSFNFNFTAPAPGTYDFRVRAINTGAISGVVPFTIAAAGAPTAVSASGAPGNTQNIITAQGTANGSPITSFDVLSSSSATGTFTKVGTITTSNPPNSGSTTGSFTHTGLTNGTAYFYRVAAVSAIETVTSASTSAVTPTSAATMPTTPVPVVRIEADQGVASDGKGGSRVTNQGSWGGDWSNPTSGAAGPAASATGWDGTRPTLIYSLDRWLQVETSTRLWRTGANPWTLMALVSLARIIKPNTFFGAGLQGGGQFRVGDDTDSSRKLGFNRQGLAEITKTPGAVLEANIRYMLVLTYDGTTTSMFINDMATPILTSTTQPNLTGQLYTLGHNGTQNTGNKEDLQGNMSANLIFETALSAADRQSWKNYLVSKWPVS